ncbi:MAG: ABC transporter ATP-binding protein [Coriobacteriia bacterium]|nr:ABC transporter ATP-binding protein [Coriobacteriia bacterium]
MADTVPLLSIENVSSGYKRVKVLRDVTMCVDAGETVAIIGANGAGKSTLMRTVVGFLTPTAGCVSFDGTPINGIRPELLVRAGVALVPEGRLLFGDMSVRENLQAGAYATRGPGRKTLTNDRIDKVNSLFPVLAERASQRAATLSGGEQQMLAIARALMSGPRLLLLDEPSLGLAPKVITEIFGALDALRADGVAIVLVEQDSRLALKHADRGYVMRSGRVVLEGSSAELLADESIRAIYLGSWNTEKAEKQ